MAFRWTTLGRLTDAEALADISAALELVDGNVMRAAHVLGVSRKQLYRYLERIPGAWEEVDRVRAKAMREFLESKARLLGRPIDGVGSESWTNTKQAPSARLSSVPPRP